MKNARLYRIYSNHNCNSLGGVLADTEEAAIALFHRDMAPVILDVYACRGGALTPRDLSAAASLLYGDRWQHSLSIALGVDYRLVRRWAQGQRPIPPWVAVRLRELLVDRVTDIRALLS